MEHCSSNMIDLFNNYYNAFDIYGMEYVVNLNRLIKPKRKLKVAFVLLRTFHQIRKRKGVNKMMDNNYHLIHDLNNIVVKYL